MKEKLIRDSVHGYISIPDDYMRLFVDTSEFQRLHDIEQTSMKCLYPCAGHDRFTHSLGTFHLGRKIFDSLDKNLQAHNPELYSVFSEEEWNKLRVTFELACLLHDCAHAPYSHLLEKYSDYYFKPSEGKTGLLVDMLCKEVTGDTDFTNKPLLISARAGNHEKASSLLLWRRYRAAFSQLGADPILAMRMIMGYSYSPSDTPEKELKNCIISLLNGSFIDVDKMDYIARDTEYSGMDNYSVDLDRLIRSVTVVEFDGQHFIGYMKSAINVVQNLITAKNNLYVWIYAHHKVAYFSDLLTRCFEKAVSILFNLHKKDEVLARCSHIISVDAICKRTDFGTKYSSFLPCDDDIRRLIKEAYMKKPDDPDFIEFFSRVYKRSVWKSHSEYEVLFSFSQNKTERIYLNAGSRTDEMIAAICDKFGTGHSLANPSDWRIIQTTPKMVLSEYSDILIKFDDKVKEFSKLAHVSSTDISKFFYLYHAGNALTTADKHTAIQALKPFSA